MADGSKTLTGIYLLSAGGESPNALWDLGAYPFTLASGGLSATASSNVAITGVFATSSVGTAAAKNNSVVAVIGRTATGSAGTSVAIAGSAVAIAGRSVTAAKGILEGSGAGRPGNVTLSDALGPTVTIVETAESCTVSDTNG